SEPETVLYLNIYDVLKSQYTNIFEVLKNLSSMRFTWLVIALASMERDHVENLIYDIRKCSV
ncbi:MAG: hypothetical protein K8R73_10640, partial [Clostridiales bacterium]|nr:hypothetical protein [Clostridiales bacterium]